MSIFLIVGTRPQIIKSVPVIKESLNQGLCMHLIHTGQHYDYALSQLFFEELSPPKPYVNLNVGSGSQVFQIAEIMLRLEKCLVAEKPSLVIIPGDTNSALAGALTCAKLGIPFAHLESGARSYDMKMAEEINRRLIDHCAQFLFAPTANCEENLKKESVTGKIFQTGDTMYDVFLSFQAKANENRIIDKLNLTDKGYAILTTHRAENVDDPKKLKQVLRAVQNAKLLVVFPIHPRTKCQLEANGISLDNTNIIPIDPLGYIEMLALLKHAKLVITDSGGLQKEAFWSKVPCITIRDRTEWTETVSIGVNFVTDTDTKRINQALREIETSYSAIQERFKENPFGDGNSSYKIVKILSTLV
jgi:UDP-N-acetylglucosamine 2-epimerase